MIFTTRFAPSPTGPLHLGHAYSSLMAFDHARAAGGRFHLRMDDIDQSRARPHWADQIQRDLTWLGLSWDGPIWSQNARGAQYHAALRALWDMDVLYPCTCSRADIKVAVNAPQEGAPLTGPDGLIYPGTCRDKTKGAFSLNSTLRLNMKKAMQLIDNENIIFNEESKEHGKTAPEMIAQIGDVVLARKDMVASYHLSVVVDDAQQCITHVIRGEDLRDATYIHVLLQQLLKLPTPQYLHHRLIRDEHGKRLAKRDDARAIAKYRDEGVKAEDIRRMVGL